MLTGAPDEGDEGDGSAPTDKARADAALAAVVNAWPSLPDAVRTAIATLASAAAGPKARPPRPF